MTDPPIRTGPRSGRRAGNQAASTVTRALDDVRPRDVLKAVAREVRTGLCLGLILGAVGLLAQAITMHGCPSGVRLRAT